MKTKLILGLILGLVAAVSLSGTPAGAASDGTPQGPEIVDASGDANFANAQGTVTSFGMSTPGSIAGADIRAIWFETDFNRVRDLDANGVPTRVRHVPTALELNIKTEAPPIPSFGPTLIYRVQTTIGRCNVHFEAIVRGPDSLAQDPAQGAQLRKMYDSAGTTTAGNGTMAGGCPGGTGAVTNAAFTLTSAGNVMTLRFPLSALPYSSTQLTLQPDVVIKPQSPALATLGPRYCDPAQVLCANGGPIITVNNPQSHNPHVKAYPASAGASLNGVRFADLPTIDETYPYQGRFRIGADVPGDIDCTPDAAGNVPAACTA